MKFDAFFLQFLFKHIVEKTELVTLACHNIAGLYTVVYPGVTSP